MIKLKFIVNQNISAPKNSNIIIIIITAQVITPQQIDNLLIIFSRFLFLNFYYFYSSVNN